MDCEQNEGSEQRGMAARAGITALNLISPGLGLFRVADWRVSLICLLAPFVLIAVLPLGLGHFPITSFAVAVSTLVVVLAALLALYIIPMVLTWRESRLRASVPLWSRWYSLTAIAVVMLLLSNVASSVMHRFFKPFYAPSVSMAPTIGKGDRFVVDMGWRGPLMRGQVVVFHAPDGDRISRIAAVAGDRIAMRRGVPIVNGIATSRRPIGTGLFADYNGPRRATLLLEQLPGEALWHQIFDAGPSDLDEMPEAIVPPAHFFVLGDNRDRAADSRAPASMLGVGMVPVTAIIGRAMYIHWSADHAKVGMRLDR